MFNSIKQFFRLLQIARILSKHNSLFFLQKLGVPGSVIIITNLLAPFKKNGREGERLLAAITELGPGMIKFGQFLAVRNDLMGEEISQYLSRLQDKLPPFHQQTAKNIIESELGKPISELFDDFNDKPVAAASVAQVHFALDKQGKKIAVKILRPNIEKIFKRDIECFEWLAKISERKFNKLKRLKLKEVVRNFAEWVRLELDLRLEAAGASELKENSKNDQEIFVPEIYWQFTSRKVMVLERIEGIKIDNREELVNAGYDVNAILAKASALFFKHVFRDGFFHADLHPGNVFVIPDGRIAVVDFGIMGRLDWQTRIFLAEMMMGFLNRDYKKVSDVHFEAGFVPKTKSRELFAQACRSIGEPIFGKPQNEISISELLAQLFKISEDFDMETQPQLLLLQKTMILAEGIGRKLNSQANFWESSRPLVEEWIKENMGVKSAFKKGARELNLLINRINNIGHLIDKIPELLNVLTKPGK